MSAGNLGMLEYGADALAGLGTEPAEAEACARLIARYAKSPDDGDLIADVLGIDMPPSLRRCPVCTDTLGSLRHAVLCEPELTAARIHLLADDTGRAS